MAKRSNFDRLFSQAHIATPTRRGASPSRPGKGVGRPSGVDFLKAIDRKDAQVARKRKAKREKKDSGFSLGDLFDEGADFGANLVQGTLEAADVPGSFIRSHLADIAGQAEEGDVGGVARGLLNTVTGAAPQLVTGVGHAAGVDVGDVDKSFYEAKKHAKDFQEHTGIGTYLERAIKRNPKGYGFLNESIGGHIPGTPLDLGVSGKDVLGFAGDVGTDPLTYVTGGASKILEGGAKAAAREIASQGGQRLGQRLLNEATKGGKVLTKAARKDIEKQATKQAEADAAMIVRHGKGARNIPKDRYEAYFGNKGGIRLRNPGTGRVGRRLGLASEEQTVGLIPKAVTDVANPALDKIKGAAQTLGEKTVGRVSNKAELVKALRTGTHNGKKLSDHEIAQLLKAETIRGRTNLQAEAGLRLRNAEGTKVPARNVVHDALKSGKHSGDRNIIEAVESGAADSIPGGREVQDLQDKIFRASKKAGLDVSYRKNHVPWAFTQKAKEALGLTDRAAGQGAVKARSEFARNLEDQARKGLAEARGVKPKAVSTADARAFAEETIRREHPELTGDVFETNLAKIFEEQLSSTEHAIRNKKLGEGLKAENIVGTPEHGARVNAEQVKKAQRDLRATEREQEAIRQQLAANKAERDAASGQLELVSAPVTPAAKQEAVQRTLDLGWNAATTPADPQRLADRLQDATQRAAAEPDNEFAQETRNILDAAVNAPDAREAKALELQAAGQQMQEQLEQLGIKRGVQARDLKALQKGRKAEQMRRELQRSLEPLQANPELAGNRDVVEIINSMDKVVGSPEHFKTFLKYYDRALNNVKAWQLATPGFHTRNLMGGTFNNFLAGVELFRGSEFEKDYRLWQRGSLTGAKKEYMDDIVDSIGAGQYAAGEVGALAGNRTVPIIGTNARLNRLSRAAGGRVEFHLRGTLAYDRLLKGKSLDDALADVVKYHFDYQDLSGFERNVLKRVVPFYAWTRYNVPLQIETFLRAPGKYSRYWQAREELEAPVDKGTVVPSYFASLFGIPTDQHAGNGNQLFLTPDLPNTQSVANAIPNFGQYDSKDPVGSTLFGVLEPYLSQVTPLVKAPTELLHGEQIFKGIPLKDEPYLTKSGKPEPNPRWAPPPVAQALEKLGLATRKVTRNGRTYRSNTPWVTQKGIYLMEQEFPFLSRVDVLAPTSGKDKERQGSKLASLLGIPIRENTSRDQQNERVRRRFARKGQG